MPLSTRCQLTVNFGSNEKGQYYSDLLDKLAKRYHVDKTEVIRIALRTLNITSKDAAVIEETI